ncbi:MAG: hypothetical protein A2V90_00375 [Gammaproteobacteria bacterium RBG_16_57_12]|nr:MAG: hypothetical protein A2V90_00375 [Gammaproteobacteria bacterium RBG_16_57_12]
MATKYVPLVATSLEQGASYHRVPHGYPELVRLDDPAKWVMTDLKMIQAFTIEPEATIEAANIKMIACGVRLLLVTNTLRDIIGLITATDILGEKPMQFLGKVGGTHRDILVSDIMTPQASLEVLHMVDVERARVGNIVETLKRSGRQHALVVDINEQGMTQKVRGIFSGTQISRQMGVVLEVPEIAHNFAELEQTLAH